MNQTYWLYPGAKNRESSLVRGKNYKKACAVDRHIYRYWLLQCRPERVPLWGNTCVVMDVLRRAPGREDEALEREFSRSHSHADEIERLIAWIRNACDCVNESGSPEAVAFANFLHHKSTKTKSVRFTTSLLPLEVGKSDKRYKPITDSARIRVAGCWRTD